MSCQFEILRDSRKKREKNFHFDLGREGILGGKISRRRVDFDDASKRTLPVGCGNPGKKAKIQTTER